MPPPGLGFIALSERAWQKTKKAKLPRFYFDLNLERKNQAKGSGAFTPAVSLIFGLRASLNMMAREGFRSRLRQTCPHGAGNARGGNRHGLKLLAPDSPSPAATGIFLPDGLTRTRFWIISGIRWGRSRRGTGPIERQSDPHRSRRLHGRLRCDHGHCRSEMALRKFGAEILRPWRRCGQEVLMEALN